MKKTGYLFLLAILLLQCGGIFVYYGFQQNAVKREMREKLSEAKSGEEYFTLTISEFRKSKLNEDEISINGKMYDIKSIFISGNKVEITALYDLDEEDIIERINLTINNSSKQNGNDPNPIVKLLTSVYLNTNFSPTLFIPEFNTISFQQVNEKMISHLPEISSPPPRFV